MYFISAIDILYTEMRQNEKSVTKKPLSRSFRGESLGRVNDHIKRADIEKRRRNRGAALLLNKASG